MERLLDVTTVMLNLPVFMLVLARIAGIVSFAPFFGSNLIPVEARVLLALFISFIVFPFMKVAVSLPASLSGVLVVIISEFAIGLMVGLVFQVVFSGLELAGLAVGQQLGIALAQVFDPLFEEDVSILGRLFYLLAVVAFLLIRGHIILIGALIDSLNTLPVGTFLSGEDILSVVVLAVKTSFVLAIQVAAPILVAIFLATLAMGFITRTVPQFNILTVGFSVRLLLGFVLLVFSLSPMMDVFLFHLDKIFGHIVHMLGM